MKKRPALRSRNLVDAPSVTAFALASQVGLGIVLPLVAGGLLGWYLDGQVFHSHIPVATVIGLLLGLIIGVFGLIRLVSLLR
ncbi:MAG TPA: AtpZ/AtpI family protein [Ktedonobacterales bacterium]